jgi:general secretion pathway protein M
VSGTGALDKLAPREQRLLAALGVVFAVIVLLGLPAYLYGGLSQARDHNAAIRDVLRRMDQASGVLAKRRQERDARERKYANKAPALASFIEGAARGFGLEVPESTDQPDVAGKGYTERITQVKMQKVSLKPLVQALEKMEAAGYPIAVTRLRISTRATGADLYDVTLAVSAYDKKSAEPKDQKHPKSTKTAKPKGQPL